jgi:hypothetical protein
MQPASGQLRDSTMSKINILFCEDGYKARKTFQAGIEQRGYQAGTFFTANEHEVNGIKALSECLLALENFPRAYVIRGARHADNQEEWSQRRQGREFIDIPRSWIMVDIDKLDWPAGMSADEAVQYAVSLLPAELQGVSYHYQWSASAGIKPGIRLHLWYWLDEPIDSEQGQRWADTVNESGQIKIDGRLFKPTQPHYTARADYVDMPDPFPVGRSGFVELASDAATLVIPPIVERVRPAPRVCYSGLGTFPAGHPHSDVQTSLVHRLLELLRDADYGNEYDEWRALTYATAEALGSIDAGVSAMTTVFGEWKSGDYDNLFRPGPSLGDAEKGMNILWKRCGDCGVLSDAWEAQRQILRAAHDHANLSRQAAARTTGDMKRSLLDGCVYYLGSDCGAGKTYELGLIMKDNLDAHWVVAIHKRDAIHERINELEVNFGINCNNTDIAAIYSVPRDKTVGEKLALRRRDLDQRTGGSITFITHAALLMSDWRDWNDSYLICDEVTDPWCHDEIDAHNHPGHWDAWINGSPTDDLVRLTLTKAGLKKHRTRDYDSLDVEFRNLLTMAANRNTVVWTKTAEWAAKEVVKVNAIVDHASIIPHFRAAIFASDDIEQTFLWRIWNADRSWVQWDWQPRQRAIPLKQRIRVHYITERNASKSLMLDPSAIAAMQGLSSLLPSDYYWTANKAKPIRTQLELSLKGTLISPVARGQNTLQHHTCCVWLAALKPNPSDKAAIEESIGMTKYEIVEAREMAALWQFIMRSALRDYGAQTVVDVWVLGRDQAKYLQNRVGCEIQYHDIGIPGPIKTGRKPKVNALTAAERKRSQRLRAKNATNGE